MFVWLIVVLGLMILLLVGDVLVCGVVNISLWFGIFVLIVSLIIVVFGILVFEFLIVISVVDDYVPGLVLGNVIGFNMVNIFLVFGILVIFSWL